MGYSDAQKEIPSSPGTSKVVKKSRIRKARAQAKKINEEAPRFNRYHGYA